MSSPDWLEIAKKLQSISQAGLEYSKDKYDLERFEEIRNISIEIIKNHTEYNSEKIRDLFANESGYQTPKIDVRAAIFKEGKILLIREKLDNRWALPGGWADVDCSLRENLIKESLEEAGAKIDPERVIAILDRKHHNLPPYPYGIYKIFVLCKLIEYNFQHNIETSDADFFSLDNLPELSEGRNTFAQIKMCFDAAENENFKPVFD